MTSPIDYADLEAKAKAPTPHADLERVVAYLRDEADFNRSWTDGRRGAQWSFNPEYHARRIEIAEEREGWAAAIISSLSDLKAKDAEIERLQKRVDRFDQIIATRCGDHLSHIEIAAKVRMLMRHDLNHEVVCELGRDRIVYLADRLGEVTEERDALADRVKVLEAEIEHLRGAEGYLRSALPHRDPLDLTKEPTNG